MPIYEVEVNGTVFEVDSPTPPTADVIRRLAGQQPPAPAAATPPAERSLPADVAPDPNAYGMDAPAGAHAYAGQGAPARAPSAPLLQFRDPAMREAIEGAERMDAPLMPPGAVLGARSVATAIPTRARAGAKFQEVMGAVGNKPVDIARPGDAALRIQQLSERGASMPKAVRDFLKRATDPQKGDMTYQEVRDFYSNISRLSSNEFQRLNPVVRLEVGKLRVAMDRALAKTAASGGKEEMYRQAMKEYRVASRIREVATAAAKYGAGALGAGAALKAGQAIID